MTRTTRTPEKDTRFFEAVAGGLPIGEAAAAAGYSRRSVYEYKEADAEFASRWQEADDLAVDRMEKEADRRALDGTEKPVFHQGNECGRIREFSDVLLMFRLKGKRPKIYRDNASVELAGKNGGKIQTEHSLAGVPDDELRAALAILRGKTSE